MGAVLRVVDGAFAESSCVHNEAMGGVCVEGESCGLKQIWKDVQGAVEKILFATTLRRGAQADAERRGPARGNGAARKLNKTKRHAKACRREGLTHIRTTMERVISRCRTPR